MPETHPRVKPSKKAPQGTSRKPVAPKKIPGRGMSKEELSRHEREVRANRMILAGMGIFGALLVAVLALGFWREYVAKSSESVAVVAGQPIGLESYARRLDFRRKSTEQQIQYMQAQLQTTTTAGSGGDALANLFRQQIQQLQFSMILMPDQTLDQMIDEELVRQEAARRALPVSAEEIDQQIKETFGDQPTPVPAPSPTAGPAAAGQPTAEPSPAPTVGSTATPAPTADVQARLSGFLAAYNMSMADYRAMVETQLLYEKLQKAMGETVPTTEDQIHARHILVDSEEKAKEIRDKLRGGASFQELAKAESKDTSNKDQGGDLGWFGRGRMVPEFETVAFQLEPNKLSDPVKTSFGWHVIEVLEKDPMRPLDEAALTSRRNAAITDWLGQSRNSPEVKRELTEERKNWVYQKIKWRPSA